MSTYGIPAPIKPQPWQVDALCAQADPEAWLPPQGGSPDEAVMICHRCPVIADCREYALEAEGSQHWRTRYGIYGGLLPVERYSISVQPRERECAECGKTFQYTHANRRYCGDECRHIRHRQWRDVA